MGEAPDHVHVVSSMLVKAHVVHLDKPTEVSDAVTSSPIGAPVHASISTLFMSLLGCALSSAVTSTYPTTIHPLSALWTASGVGGV